ncbi:MAG: lytic transglycosylase domain-containing protein, partial [Deltaproteobacteria bacterium]
MGIRYLALMVQKFGDVDLGLMAYNAGPSRLRAYRVVDEVPDSVRSYVRKVRREERLLRGEQSRARGIERSVLARCVASHQPPTAGRALDTSTAMPVPAMRGPLEWPKALGLAAARWRARSPAPRSPLGRRRRQLHPERGALADLARRHERP